MREYSECLLDIKEAIEHIEKYAKRGKDEFEKEELVQYWIIYHLQIIGEAATRLSLDFRRSHPDIPWSKIIGMRNILVHKYFGIDISIVWTVVEHDLPILKQNINKMLKDVT